MPTLVRTLGVKGYRPTVGTWDNKDQVYAFASINLITAQLTPRLLQSTAAQRRKKTLSRTRRMQQAFARHLRDVGRRYPKEHFPRVVITLDNAPWHRGPSIRRALDKVLHVEFLRLPSYSPQLNVIERFWKLLRQRATHNRLFGSPAELKQTLRKHLRWLKRHRAPLHSLSSTPASGQS